MGNPGAFSYSHTLWAKGFLDGLGSPHYYSAGSQDVNNRFAASALLYGSPLLVPIPDLNRTRLPVHGRREPARLARLRAVGAARARAAERRRRPRRARGGGRSRAAPRRRASTSTSRSVPTRTPGCCSRCCTSSSRRGSRTAPGWSARGAGRRDAGRAARATSTPSARRRITGVPAETVRELARAFAAAPERGRIRAHRFLPGPLRHAGRLPARCAERRHREPRPAGRCGLRPAADRTRRDRREGGARHLRQGALAHRRTSPT